MTTTPSLDPAAIAALNDLLRQVSGPEAAPVILREYAHQQLDAVKQVKESRYKSFRSPLTRLVDGTHSTCGCECEACTSKDGCPCACGCEIVTGAEGHLVHRGQPGTDTDPGHAPECTGRPGSCAARWTGRGDVPMSEVTVADLEQAQAWVRTAAKAYNLRIDRKRAAQGKPEKFDDGRGASAWFVRAARWLWGRALDDGIVVRDPSQRLRVPQAHDGKPRAMTPEEVMEVIAVAGSTGEDPHLGGIVTTTFFATGARRGGILTAIYGRLDVDNATFQVSEPKRVGARHVVAIPPDLAHALHHHALERGPRVPAPADAPEAVRRAGIPALKASDPLLYRMPVDEFDEHGYFLRRTVAPITVDAVESIRDRIRDLLPWTQERWLRWHDFRHTIGTMLDRIGGHAVAEYHLGHKTPQTTTSIYTRAGLAEDAAAVSILFNCDHPLAPPRHEP